MAIFIDFSKCFDTLNHEILLHKLKYLGFDNQAIKWFHNYLSGRKQFVDFKGNFSCQETLKIGVPQGSVLGPLLYLIYTAEIENVKINSLPTCFADDTSLIISAKTTKHLFELARIEMEQFTDWFTANKLTINLSKTNYMLFDRENHNETLIIKGNQLTEVPTFKLVGVILDNNLSWKDQYEYLLRKIRPTLRALYLVKPYLDTKSKLLLYRGLIESHITYCMPIWGNLNKSQQNSINVIMNRAMRAVYNLKPRESAKPSYLISNSLNYEQLLIYNNLTYIKQIVNSKSPVNLKALLPIENSRNPNTRQAYDKTRLESQLYTKTKLYNQTIPTAVRLWNILQPELRELPINSFKNKLKQILLDVIESEIN